MDHQLQSLLRQYSDSPSNELATQIANRTVRSKIDPKPFTFMEKCKEYNETVRILEVELAEDVKKELQNLIKSPVVSIKWDQYTPYFNDGDSCEFTVFEEGAMIQFEDSEEFIESWDNGTWDDTTREYIFTPEEEIKDQCFEQVINFLHKIPDSILLQTFGDHATITITKENFNVEHCDHD